jgi:hypothetical protein
MEQRIRGHFREAQCLVVILEKPTAFVVKMAKISAKKKGTERFYTMYTIRSEEIENFSHLIRTHLTPHAEPTRQVS